MRRLAVLCLVAALVSGCAVPTERPRMVWDLSESSSGGAKLVLGVPQTDDVAVVMACQPHSGAVDLTLVGRPGDSAVVELHAGKVWNRYLGAGHADEETDGVVHIDFKLAAADPVLAQLADTGTLTIQFVERRMILPNAFAPAHDFLALCRLPG